MCAVPGPRLVGRDEELARLRDLIDRARGGSGGVVRYVGEAGIGKTALLNAAVGELPSDVRVLRVAGYETEVDLPWAGVETLLAPLLTDGLDAEVAEPRRAALRAALALDGVQGSGGVDAFAAAAGVRDLVVRAAAVTPIVIVVDDVHWLDEPSVRALRFGTRWWSAHQVAVIEAGRPAPRHHPDERRLLGPIDHDAASALLSEAGVVSASARRRFVDELGGRPLLLAAAAAEWRADAPGLELASGPLPAPPSVLARARARLDQLSPDTQRALLVAATAPAGDGAVVGRALATLGLTFRDLDQAERAGVVTVGSGGVEFDHPTLRSAAFHGASGAERRAVHRAVGEAIDDPVVRIQHLALSALGPDAELCDDLERATVALVRRGAPVEAARALELASRLAPDAAQRAVFLRRSAELLADTAAAPMAALLLDRADVAYDEPSERLRRRVVRLRLAARADDAVADDLIALADEVEDPALSIELLFEAMPPLVRAMRAHDLLGIARRVHELVVPGDAALALRAEVALGAAMLATGDDAGGPLLDRHMELLAVAGSASCGGFLAEVAAPVVGFLRRSEEADVLLDRLERDVRDRDAIPVLISVLGARAMLVHGRDLRAAARTAAEAVALARSIDQPDLGRLAGASLVVATAMIGDEAECRQAAAWLAGRPDVVSRRAALYGLGALELGLGRLTEALAVYDRLRAEFGIGTGVVRWEAEWVESLVRSRRIDDAHDALAEIEAAGAGTWAAGIERMRGLLAPDGAIATEHFERSVELLTLGGNAVGLGRTHLVWGERLRRARRRAAAREQLELAHDLLAGAGAEVWARRAADELERAHGVVRSQGHGPPVLTDQELHVARLAARGASNQEIGLELYVSPRTVETHLSSIYRKLGVRNRRELAARALDDERLRI